MLESEKSSLSFDDFVEKMIKNAGKADEVYMKKQTNHYIPASLRPNWTELKNDLIAKLERMK